MVLVLKRKNFGNPIESYLRAHRKIARGVLAGTKFDRDALGLKKGLEQEDESLNSKLEALAKENGTRIVRSKGFNNPHYGNTVSGRLGKKAIAVLHKKGYKKEAHKLRDSFISQFGPFKEMYNNLGRDAIGLGSRENGRIGHTNSANVLAHEMGHSDHTMGRVKGLEGKVGKALHHVRSSPLGNAINVGGRLVIPVVAGYKQGGKIDKKKGWKNLGDYGKGLGVSLISGAVTEIPTLGTEYLASKRGGELLKELGASKEMLENYKESMKNAGKTYLANSVANLLFPTLAYTGTYAARAGGKLIKEKLADRKKRDEESEKEK